MEQSSPENSKWGITLPPEFFILVKVIILIKILTPTLYPLCFLKMLFRYKNNVAEALAFRNIYSPLLLATVRTEVT